MATGDPVMSTLTVQRLLGRPLNDIEDRYSPELLFIKGPMHPPLPGPRVSIVGSRKASAKGLSDATKISRVLAENGVVIVSGLAEGIDTCAHEAAMKVREGKTIAVLGTPLDRTYPKKNHWLQLEIMNHYLAISQFQIGHQTRPEDFIARNRTMALISDATIIVEAGPNSGSRHQGWEAIRLGRPLFIWKPILDQPELGWPREQLKYGAVELDNPIDVIESLPSSLEVLSIPLS
jgi:DNA processing protein